ncbi:hypothetical protein SteCoe_4884 [Stentor coeruleus]|uniref:Myb-like DNA-binding domain containing protein n=1 Tax=Stentor coeruleus TaxID=5963 RepID=A0A1R2CTM6_9CILI|nr:hypothetical protein SteCoe_4884 [Stentor coeruleus]
MEIKTGKVWTLQEDLALIDLMNTVGCKRWTKISEEMSKKYGILNRSPKQCRDRWVNNIDPAIIKEIWTKEEDDILFDKHSIYGNKWCKISKFLQRRCGNSIKNRFYSIVRVNLRKYNKNIPEEYQLKGSLKSLLKVKNIRDILVKRPENQDSNDEAQALNEIHDESIFFINSNNHLNEEFMYPNYVSIIKNDTNDFEAKYQNLLSAEIKFDNRQLANNLESDQNQNDANTVRNIFRVFLRNEKNKRLKDNKKKSKEPGGMVNEINTFYKGLFSSTEKSQEIFSKFGSNMILPFIDFSCP